MTVQEVIRRYEKIYTVFKLKQGDNVIRYSSELNEKSLEVVLTFDEVMAGI